MSITYGEIIIEGIEFTKILMLKISHKPNEHGYITIAGEIDSQKAQEFTDRADETTQIIVKAKGEEEQTLFNGGILNIAIKNEADYSILTINGITSSYTQYIQKLSRSYQNTTKTYEQILNEAYQGNGSVDVTVEDKPIGAFIMQMNETNWEFTKRMASRFNAPIFTSIIAPKPMVYVGLPPVGNTKEITTTSYGHGKDENKYNTITQNYMADNASAMRQDFSGFFAHSLDYVYLGDQISLNQKTYFVKSVEAVLIDGLLEMTYELVGKTAFVAPIAKNDNCSGRILTGQVRAVKQDLVQVHLLEIDKDFDSSGNWWFPYSTAYSSSDGSGWYVMPEIGDYVRIMFPSGNEAAGFAASSANKAPLSNPRHKSFRAPSGKEVLMTDEGMYIICNHQKIFIDLTPEHGIKIVSDKDINIVSTANIAVSANKDIQILAKKQVYIGTPESFITITPEQISLAAKDVIIT